MKDELYPESGPERLYKAKSRRRSGVDLVGTPPAKLTGNNGDNTEFHDTLPMAFTKGLDHDPATGFVKNTADFDTFVEELTQPGSEMGTDTETRRKFKVPTNKNGYLERPSLNGKSFRVWESPLSGMAYDNQGPDPDGVAMAPAPKLGESELCAEMAEVYAMAIVRDMPFSEIEQESSDITYVDHAQKGGNTFKNGKVNYQIKDLIAALNSLNWFVSPDTVTTSLGGGSAITQHEKRRQIARGDGSPAVTAQTLFRGSSAGCKEGPYISQFLLQGAGGQGPGGNARDAKSGQVAYGAQSISQKVSTNTPGIDWMTNWIEWVSVQNGQNVSGEDAADNAQRFITTPRDLATYVHIDELYQAYFVAALMLSTGARGDVGFPEPNGMQTRAPFATFGGPHLLSQLTEVASRALRAVRRQKFQINRRARPECLAARIALGSAKGTAVFGSAEPAMTSILTELGLKGGKREITKLFDWVDKINTDRNQRAHYDIPKTPDPLAGKPNYLLPMAFPEGSPMHPAYGAGHATVAGACTTVLKAFFNIYDGSLSAGDPGKPNLTAKTMASIGFKQVLQAKPDGSGLDDVANAPELTIEGELNKLAANIAIGRNFAGVHYYTDYYDSLRMGERVAIGILREHLISHPEPIAMHLKSFDGDTIRIETAGDQSTKLRIWDAAGDAISEEAWWTRDVAEFEDRPNSSAPYLVAASAPTSNWEK
ncbi:MAG: vanadium-dependent haloperoxidase [Pseudomonadota bacterium]